jgi:UDP-3-O-[3-hydroxymyristoyl] glucosamine N-acyltransferase
MTDINSSAFNKFQSLTQQNLTHMKFTAVTTPERGHSSSLVFTSSVAMTEVALKNGVLGFIVLEKIYDEVKALFTAQHCVWTTKQINASMAEVLKDFDRIKRTKSIHPTAIVYPTAKIGLDVHIGEYAVIKDHVIIGDNTYISAHVVVEDFCEIGSDCRIASHTTIGSDGFGYYTDKTFSHHKIPQIGKVVIEDRCELGSHCSVDRATLTETRIKAGSKLDNFCHIAHNCEIGENSILAAGFMTAGSTVAGKNMMTGGGVLLNGHIKITDNVILAGKTGVVSDVDTPGVYGGFPQVPQKENLRIMSSLAFLPKLRRQVSQILKHLNLEEGN